MALCACKFFLINNMCYILGITADAIFTTATIRLAPSLLTKNNSSSTLDRVDNRTENLIVAIRPTTDTNRKDISVLKCEIHTTTIPYILPSLYTFEQSMFLLEELFCFLLLFRIGEQLSLAHPAATTCMSDEQPQRTIRASTNRVCVIPDQLHLDTCQSGFDTQLYWVSTPRARTVCGRTDICPQHIGFLQLRWLARAKLCFPRHWGL
mmetsp:Transcript_28879/g.46478  ORF Transcript_28879/g.46478 Transcript_28879/m.46478 type:complete len:208 (-) Transcript_28879:32-655(-)